MRYDIEIKARRAGNGSSESMPHLRRWTYFVAESHGLTTVAIE